MVKLNEAVFDVQWSGEMAAGIRAGSEVITVSMEYGPMDDEARDYFASALADYFEGAAVTPRKAKR